MSCFASITAGASVVTANQRLYRAIVDDYDARCLADGRQVWETADVLPWAPWLERLWREAAPEARAGERVLSELEELLLWEQIIAADPQTEALLQLTNTAQAARDAATLLHVWQITPAELATGGSRDVRAFHLWQRRFAAHCHAHAWLPRAALSDRVIGLLQAGQLRAPATIWLAGFAELTPQQSTLFEALRAAGSRVDDYPQQRCKPVPRRIAFADSLSETTAVAQWIRRHLAAQADKRIGVVVPQLGGAKTRLRNVLDDVLAPAALLPGAAPATLPYNLSLGDPLARYPLIDTALRILRLATGRLSVDEIGCLLRTPFIGAADEEQAGRACFDAELRNQRRLELGLPALLSALTSSKLKSTNAGLLTLVERLRQACDAWPRRAAPSSWAGYFAALLSAAGWPGGRSPDVGEYQTLESWRALLDRYAGLDTLRPQLETRDAVSLLRRLAGQQIFQPRSPRVPVQVLGPLEAIGQRFDHLWIMNLHDEVWPESPRPTPFIPIRLQRDKGIARASPERELEYAKAVLNHLLATAPEVMLSYPRNEIDRELRPSPLIRGYADVDPGAFVDTTKNHAHRIHVARQLEQVDDAMAPAVAADARVRGGTSLLRDQAACPFRAFAHHRLNAKSMEVPAAGLDAAERGQLTHKALHLLWARLRDHSRLVELDESGCRVQVGNAVEHAVDAYRRQRPDAFGARFTGMEQARLTQLLMEWLVVDRARPPFSVAGVETKHPAVLDGMTLDTRIDRIDRLADGRTAIIDYKTGNPDRVRISNWFSERPEDPQLPLYAITTKGAVGAVLFARVNKGRSSYVGLSESADTLPGIPAFAATREATDIGDWSALLTDWSTTLNSIARQYRRGDARVAPKHPRVCDTCDLQSFCRIMEREPSAT